MVDEETSQLKLVRYILQNKTTLPQIENPDVVCDLLSNKQVMNLYMLAMLTLRQRDKAKILVNVKVNLGGALLLVALARTT